MQALSFAHAQIGLLRVGSKLVSASCAQILYKCANPLSHAESIVRRISLFPKAFNPLMAHLLEEGQHYTSATTSSRLAYSDVGSVGDLTSYSTPKEFHDYTASSTEVTPQHSPATVRRTSSLPRSNRGGSSMVMNDRDKGIYNSLGSSSSSSGKVLKC